MATLKTLAAILPLLAFAPAAAEESVPPAYVMPQIPSEAEKIAALKLGYQINGNSMVKTDSSIDLTALTAPTVPRDYLPYRTLPVARERQAIGVK
jgi:hypothetical protein